MGDAPKGPSQRKHDPATAPIPARSFINRLKTAGLVLVCALGFLAGLCMLIADLTGSDRSEDHKVRLTCRPPGFTSPDQVPGIRFELPEGWKIKYNGHQRWRSGTAVDAEGNPQMEVTLFAYAGNNPNTRKWSEFVETASLPIGEIEIRKRTERDAAVFLSIPTYESKDTLIVEYDFYVGDHILGFRIRGRDQKRLQPMIWQIMETGRLTGDRTDPSRRR